MALDRRRHRRKGKGQNNFSFSATAGHRSIGRMTALLSKTKIAPTERGKHNSPSFCQGRKQIFFDSAVPPCLMHVHPLIRIPREGYTDCDDGQSLRLAYCVGNISGGSARPRKSIRSLPPRRDPSIRDSLWGKDKAYSLFLNGLCLYYSTGRRGCQEGESDLGENFLQTNSPAERRIQARMKAMQSMTNRLPVRV